MKYSQGFTLPAILVSIAMFLGIGGYILGNHAIPAPVSSSTSPIIIQVAPKTKNSDKLQPAIIIDQNAGGKTAHVKVGEFLELDLDSLESGVQTNNPNILGVSGKPTSSTIKGMGCGGFPGNGCTIYHYIFQAKSVGTTTIEAWGGCGEAMPCPQPRGWRFFVNISVQSMPVPKEDRLTHEIISEGSPALFVSTNQVSSPIQGVATGSTQVSLGSFNLEPDRAPDGFSMTLSKISLSLSNLATNDIGELYLYDQNNTLLASWAAPASQVSVTFPSPIVLSDGTSETLTLRANILQNANAGDQLNVTFSSASVMSNSGDYAIPTIGNPTLTVIAVKQIYLPGSLLK